MYRMTATLIDLTRQQMAGMHSFTLASLSGVERAQQYALQMTQQMMDRQLDAFGRATAQAGALLEAAPLQPAMDGLMRSQRALVETMTEAMTETQRRCFGVVSEANANANENENERAPATPLDNALRHAMQPWQTWQQWSQWAAQWMAVSRMQAAQQAPGDAPVAAAQVPTERTAASTPSTAAALLRAGADAVTQTEVPDWAGSDAGASAPADLPSDLQATLQADEVTRRLEDASAQGSRQQAGDGPDEAPAQGGPDGSDQIQGTRLIHAA